MSLALLKDTACLDCGERPAVTNPGVCRRCDRRRKSLTPSPDRWLRYTGQACRCGCGRPARGRSGYHKVCYNRAFYRDRRWQTVVSCHLDTRLEAREISAGLSEIPRQEGLAGEALRACRMLMVEINQGRLFLMRSPGTRR